MFTDLNFSPERPTEESSNKFVALEVNKIQDVIKSMESHSDGHRNSIFKKTTQERVEVKVSVNDSSSHQKSKELIEEDSQDDQSSQQSSEDKRKPLLAKRPPQKEIPKNDLITVESKSQIAIELPISIADTNNAAKKKIERNVSLARSSKGGRRRLFTI